VNGFADGADRLSERGRSRRLRPTLRGPAVIA
jgi:hypothetical protein